MHSLTSDYLDRLAFSAEQVGSLTKLGECRGRQDLFSKQAPEALESLRQAAVVESAESSNRLEGIVAPHARVQALVLKDSAPKTRSEQEIAGYRDALNLIHQTHAQLPISTRVVRQLHELLYHYLPATGGQYKTTDNQIVERRPDGTIARVRFRCVSAAATPRALEDLVELYLLALAQQREPLVIVPLLVLDFLCIHPFSDGNGRVARLLTTLLLYHHGHQVSRYVSLERIFEQSKQSYYDTLHASSQRWHDGVHNVHPWLDYFWGVLLRGSGELEQRVGGLRRGRGSKTDQIKQAIARRLGAFAISDIEADCPGVSRDMVRKVLRQLRDEDVIRPMGRGRGARWIRSDT